MFFSQISINKPTFTPDRHPIVKNTVRAFDLLISGDVVHKVCLGRRQSQRATENKGITGNEKGHATGYICVPLALEGEDGEERMRGFFRLLLGL